MSANPVHVARVGNADQALMIHCALARHEALLPLANALGGATLFDMPGHGLSVDWDGKTEYQGLVADIAISLCDGPTHLIGHSFGATAALRLAVIRPDLVSRLTLIEPVYFAAAKGTEAHRAHARVFRPFVMAMLAGDEEKAAQVFNDLWGETAWADLSERRRADLTNRIHLIVAGAAAIEEDADGITSAERLAELRMPVTMVRGSETQDVIVAIHEVLASRLPDVTDRVVPGAGHMLPLTHTEQVADIIRAAGSENRQPYPLSPTNP
ncbi:alpha/beta fold hydrolase [Yoonia sp. 2307UL14-13]|uniref:alpha/beta fold hydrolase n=1 Tax=Yoonia sp. 2307UL14-13 TaxID=3126506 RepID=UPI0030A6C4C7